MSAKDRAERTAKEHQDRFDRMTLEGAREVMGSPNGRAFVWSILALGLEAEGEEGAGRRALARDIQRSLRLADFDGLQIMREEWERPLFNKAPQPPSQPQEPIEQLGE
jgi:hypothetical protein